MPSTTAQITNAGLNLMGQALMGTPGAQPSISWVGLGTGCGLLASGLTSGSPYTTLMLQTGLPAAIPAGASLTIVNGANTQAVTENGGGAAMGATSITVTSFNANFSYPSGSGVVTTPSATDTILFNETFRKALTSAVAGANPGEDLLTLYVAPTDSPGVTFLEIGYFAGNASSTLGSGTLVFRAIYWYAHTSSDSANAQVDSTF